MTIPTFAATVGAGLFAGASTYVSLAEHPAWLESGPAVAIRGLVPGFQRAGVMQGGLAAVSLVSAVCAWLQGSGAGWLAGGLLLATLIPYTFIVIMPTNRRLLDPHLDAGSPEAITLLVRWGRLHAVRTVVGLVVFVFFARMLARA